MTAVFAAWLPAALLGAGGFGWLRRAQYPAFVATLLAALTMAQAGLLMAIMQPGHSLWLALGIAAVAAGATVFAERENARHVIVFGGSLAAIQICDPLGGLVVAGLLPATVAVAQARSDLRKAAGLYALLLFLPAMTAGLLFYLSRFDHVSVQQFLPAAGPVAAMNLPMRLALSATPVLAAAPALALLMRVKRLHPVVLVALAAVLASAIAACNGAVREPVALIAAAAPLSLAAIAAWPQSSARDTKALAAAGLCTALSWAILFLYAPPMVSG